MALPISRARRFREGLIHPEGIAVHPDGSIWAGSEAGPVYRVAPNGRSHKVIADTGGMLLGIAFAPDLSWLAACDEKNRCVWRISLPDGRVSMFARGAGRTNLRLPNYAVFARDGTLFVSDSGNFKKANGRIFRFDADHSGRGSVWHPGPFDFANGLALSPVDESALFVACSFTPSVERIPILPDGRAGKRALYARLPGVVPDGLAFDAAGNLYVSCYYPSHIYRITPKRRVELLMNDPDAHTLGSPTNMAFGGEKFDQLYVANLVQFHISCVDLRKLGAPLACHPPFSPSRSPR